MATQQRISSERLARKVGETLDVIIDECNEKNTIGRTAGDAPEIDGQVFISPDVEVDVGELVSVRITESDEYDLYGEIQT